MKKALSWMRLLRPVLIGTTTVRNNAISPIITHSQRDATITRFYARESGRSKTKSLAEKAIQGNFECYLCPRTFNSPKALGEHFKIWHPDLYKVGIHCHRCESYFWNKEDLDNHRRTWCVFLPTDNSTTAYRIRVREKYQDELRYKDPCVLPVILGVFYPGKEYVESNPPACVEVFLGFRDSDLIGQSSILTPYDQAIESEGDNGIAHVCVDRDTLVRILIILLPGSYEAVDGEWCFASAVQRTFDLSSKTLGTFGSGRSSRRLLQKMKKLNCQLLYHDSVRMSEEVETEIGATYEDEFDMMIAKCDILVFNSPFTDEEFKGLFDKERIGKLKRGVLIVNEARAAIMDKQALLDACSTGHIAGFASYCAEHADCPAVILKESPSVTAEYLIDEPTVNND